MTDSTLPQNFVYKAPAVKWFFKFVPTFLLSNLVFALSIYIDRITPNIEPKQMELGIFGDFAFWLYDHSIKANIYVLYFAAFGVVFLLLGQAFVGRKGAVWENYFVLKHAVFEHLAEILMWGCGAFVGLAYQQHHQKSLTLAQGYGFGFVVIFVTCASYFYFFLLENERFLQQKTNSLLLQTLDTLSTFLSWAKNKIKV